LVRGLPGDRRAEGTVQARRIVSAILRVFGVATVDAAIIQTRDQPERWLGTMVSGEHINGW
jgi:hypothetical protein